MTGMFDRAFISRVQQSVDIVDVVSEHVRLDKKGGEMVGLCPFHEDHRPSMYVSEVKQIFKCFACGAGGDVFKFVQMRENLTFGQAVERLAERSGIEVEKRKFDVNRVEKGGKEGVDPNRLAKANVWAEGIFVRNLASEAGKSARDYVLGRGISEESCEKWRIGVAFGGNQLVEEAKKAGASVEMLGASGLAIRRRDGSYADKFEERLMFSIRDVTGRVVGFGGRTLVGADAKYVNSPTTSIFDKSNCLYGINQARTHIVREGFAVVVEGYTDVIMAHQSGVENVVATLGTSFTSGHARMLKRYAKKAVVVFDGDVAGLAAANRAIEVCLGEKIDIKVVAIPDGKDPFDFLVENGKEGFEELLAGAKDVFEFKWELLEENFAKDETLAGRKQAVDEFLGSVAEGMRGGALSAVEKGLLVNRLASTLNMSSRAVNEELGKKIGSVRRRSSYGEKNHKVVSFDMGAGAYALAQREVLEVLLNDESMWRYVEEKITAESFDVPILRQIAGLLFGLLEEGEQFSVSGLVSMAEDVEVGGAITELAWEGERKGNYYERITGAVAELERHFEQDGDGEGDEALRRRFERGKSVNRRNMGMV